MATHDTTRSDALVFFGATGDLAHKQIFPALAALQESGRLDMPIVAVGRKAMPLDDMRKKMKSSLEASGSTKGYAALAKQLHYVAVDFDDAASFDGIKKAIGDAQHPLSYVALPPDLFEKVAKNLAAAGLAKGARLALEKPFGDSEAAARALYKSLSHSFAPESLFRVDHFLGKEPVENLTYFRAANPLFEAAFNCAHVASVQITMAEDFGVKGRAKFYDAVGALRDVVQNHLLELVACLAMELPSKKGHAALRHERAQLLAKIRPLTVSDVVRGQSEGYLSEEDVDGKSQTETFAALKLTIDEPRWRGVPFYIRAGKYLPVTATEAVIEWKAARHAVLDDGAPPPPNRLRFRLGPDMAIILGANVKKGGEALAGERVELALHKSGKDGMKPYERLLGDAIDGDPTLFADQAAVEASWRVVDPVMGNKVPVQRYADKSWGPKEVARVTPEGGWVDPA